MSMTALDLIRLSLKTSGVEGIGQTPDSEDTQDVLVILNAMMGQWSRKRWLMFRLQESFHTSTGAEFYGVGPGEGTTFDDVDRPDRLEAAFIRLPSSTPIDIPLEIIDAREDYSRIANKTTSGFPVCVFYDPLFPIGILYITPVPGPDTCEIHLIVKQPLAQFADLTTTIELPPEYTDALIWNLAARCRPLFGLPPEPSLTALANMSLNVIRGANAQIPRLRMPVGLPGTQSWSRAGYSNVNWGS